MLLNSEMNIFVYFQILGLVAFIWGIVARATGHFGPLESHLPAVTSGTLHHFVVKIRY